MEKEIVPLYNSNNTNYTNTYYISPIVNLLSLHEMQICDIIFYCALTLCVSDQLTAWATQTWAILSFAESWYF